MALSHVVTWFPTTWMKFDFRQGAEARDGREAVPRVIAFGKHGRSVGVWRAGVTGRGVSRRGAA